MSTLKRVILPTKGDPDVFAAAAQLVQEGICEPIIVSDTAHQLDGIKTITVATAGVNTYDKTKGLDPILVTATALVAEGRGDAIVAGADFPTEEVFFANLRILGKAPETEKIASYFLMKHPDGRKFIFLDCALDQFSKLHEESEEESVNERAEILLWLGEVGLRAALDFGLEPRIGFASFATGASSKNVLAQKVSLAAEWFREKHPDVPCDGPIQFDAMVRRQVAAKKLPNGQLQGETTVIVLPGIDAGNLAYKIAQDLGGCTSIGPLFDKFARPAHDLSRGASAEDVVEVVKVAVLQCW